MASLWLTLCSMKNSSYVGLFPLGFDSVGGSLWYGFWATSSSPNTLVTFSITSVTITINCCHQIPALERWNRIFFALVFFPMIDCLFHCFLFLLCFFWFLISLWRHFSTLICVNAKRRKTCGNSNSFKCDGFNLSRFRTETKIHKSTSERSLVANGSHSNRKVTNRQVAERKPIDRPAINGCERTRLPTNDNWTVSSEQQLQSYSDRVAETRETQSDL